VSLNTFGADEDMVVLCSVRDLTATRQLQRQLWSAQRLESVGRLAGGIAHDFNNLMMVILSCGSFIEEAIGEDDPIHEDVDAILEAAERASNLTAQLLALSRRQVQDLKFVSLNETVERLADMLRRSLPSTIALETVLAPGDACVMADESQIDQVVLNLIFNARDAMPEGGTLTIETRSVRFDRPLDTGRGADVPPGEYAMLVVGDTGVGMNDELRTQAFEPFFSTKPRHKSSGLGLSTALGMVDQSNGHMWIDSTPGLGTKINVCLPLAQQEAQDTAATSSTETTCPEARTVLVVDDNDSVRTAVTRTLSSAGYHVLEATDGLAALTLCSQIDTKIDLVVTDIVMPNMKGCELAQKLATTRPDTPILFMSGFAHDEFTGSEFADDRTSFIQKPFAPRELVETIKQMLCVE
jgi:nitrogen-specific signal transduction histidine kinase/CheY-like chemotaxis protein